VKDAKYPKKFQGNNIGIFLHILRLSIFKDAFRTSLDVFFAEIVSGFKPRAKKRKI